MAREPDKKEWKEKWMEKIAVCRNEGETGMLPKPKPVGKVRWWKTAGNTTENSEDTFFNLYNLLSYLL